MKNDVIHIRVDIETKNQIKKRAEQEHRTLSNYIMRLISDDIQKKEGE